MHPLLPLQFKYDAGLFRLAIVRPSRHETALLYLIASSISSLCLISNDMCQRRFGNLTGKGRLLARPIAER